MIRRAAACLLLVALAPFAPADDADAKKAAKAQAQECQDALLKGDYAKLIDRTHPKVVELGGGRKKMLELLAGTVKELKASGTEFVSVNVGDPSAPIKVEKGLYLALPITLELKTPDGRIKSRGGLIGFSSDGGKTWTFADTAPGRDALKKMLPDLPDKLAFPGEDDPLAARAQ